MASKAIDIFKRLVAPPTGFRSAYDAGRDAALNGASTINCSYKWFTSKESTAEWERGKSEATNGKSDR